MNKDEFIKELNKIGIKPSIEVLNKLDIYANYLLDYNKHTNLTAIRSIDEVYLKHFYDSLTITKVYDFNNCNSLIDVGTGAGFPGVVIKLFYPSINLTLIDSNNKKTKFLTELCKILKIDVEIINDRVENYSKNNLNKFDVVTSRAVANLRVLSELSIPLVKEGGLFIPLKGNITEELKEAKDTISLMHSNIIKILEFELYNNTGNRNIIVIKKNANTLINEIRSYDKIIKKPLQNTTK